VQIILFFSSPSNFVALRFVSLKQFAATSVLLILLLLHRTFIKGKVKSGILMDFIVFLSGLFKTGDFFGWIQLHQH